MNPIKDLIIGIVAKHIAEATWEQYELAVADGKIPATSDPKTLFIRGVIAAIAGMQNAIEDEQEAEKKASLN